MYPPGDGKGRVGWRTGKRRGPRRFAHDRWGHLCFFEDVSPSMKGVLNAPFLHPRERRESWAQGGKNVGTS